MSFGTANAQTSSPIIGKSYLEVRNNLIRNGWVILERKEFNRVKKDFYPTQGGGRTGVCKELKWDGGKNYRFCWVEILKDAQETRQYQKLLDDANTYDEEYLTVQFLNPMDLSFQNKVRQIGFVICSQNYQHCPTKPRGYLEVVNDKVLTKKQAEEDYFGMMTRHFTGD